MLGEQLRRRRRGLQVLPSRGSRRLGYNIHLGDPDVQQDYHGQFRTPLPENLLNLAFLSGVPRKL